MEMETSPVRQGGQAFEAEKGGLHIWSSEVTLGDGEWGKRAGGAWSLTVGEVDSHCLADCSWEENWTEDPCLHPGSECV